MVVLNRIYTRTGDDGTTALGSGERRPKYDLRIGAYGTVDETNAAIGIVRLYLADARELDAMLGLIQNDLFDLGADLAVPQREGKAERLRMLSSQVERLERDIDGLNARLGPPDLVCAARRHAGRGASASGTHNMPPRGTDDGGTRGQARRTGRRCRDPVYEPVVGLPVRRQPRRQQQRRRGRFVGARPEPLTRSLFGGVFWPSRVDRGWRDL